jgi:hypothetical protein
MNLSYIVELLMLGEAKKATQTEAPRQRATPISNSRTGKYADSILVPISDVKLVTELKKFQAIKDEPLPEFILDPAKMNNYGAGHSQPVNSSNRVHGQSMLRTKIRNLLPLQFIPKLAAMPDASKTLKNYTIKQLADGGMFDGEVEKTIRQFQAEKRKEYSKETPFITVDLERLRRQLLSAIDRGFEAAESSRANNVGDEAYSFKSPDSKIKLLIPPVKKNQDTRIEDLGFTLRDFIAYYVCNNIIDAWSISRQQAVSIMNSNKAEARHSPGTNTSSHAEYGDTMNLQKRDFDNAHIDKEVAGLTSGRNPNATRTTDV